MIDESIGELSSVLEKRPYSKIAWHQLGKIYNKQGKFNFIDIGSGNGDFLINLCKNHSFKKCIGIEIEKKSYLEACKRCKNIKNLKFYNLDVLKYNFEKTPTIFYLYEPFFDIEYNKAIFMYNKLFQNIKKINSKRYLFFELIFLIF